ncbi:DNA polymerase kappa [Cyphellophora attinorum]|uniref:DNA polymerase kappa n=1 Tax=Cyphellophora attinorum TaxID=1664694 RepID=A0A0N1HPD9_9EURO|nr:DNA polymerase kappa [Phialophora attinorum]KPI39585.1 DNA polymerase kappa [Phialophora attinorum]
MTPEEAEEIIQNATQTAATDDDAQAPPSKEAIAAAIEALPVPEAEQKSLKHHLLGPSVTKAGQDGVDLKKVSEIIYDASKGSKFFNNEEKKDGNLTEKIEKIFKNKAHLETLDLKHDLRRADDYIATLELSRDLSQYVVHIDCDAFYAAVEEIDRPELKNVPMAVGVGVLTTCNYEARKYGCRSAMAGFVAKKLCPQLICVPLNFEKYTAKAREVRAILAEYDPRYESSSIDEAYMNITDYCDRHHMEPEEAIQQLRDEVKDKCKITISAGIAPNAKIAKICSNQNKPNGQFRVPNDRAAIMAFIDKLPVRKVNGVGRVLERELDAIGIKTCGDIHQHRAYLNRLFGEKTYQFLLQTSLGLGRTDIHPADDYERKSVGTESTFRDIWSKEDLRAKLRHTAEELEKDMARVEVKGRTLCLKIKLHTYEVFTRQVCPPKAVSLADDLYDFSLPMLAKLEKEFPGMRLRLLGLRCTHLISTKKDNGNFFKPRSAKPGLQSERTTDSSEEWEVWPDEEFEAAARAERQEEMEELERLSQEHERNGESGADWHEPFGRYKFNSAPPTPDKAAATQQQVDQEETWDCPICAVPQPADDRNFNAHIDLCLSRQTIREAVAQTQTVPVVVPQGDSQRSRTNTPEVPNRPRSANSKRKGVPGPSGLEAVSKQRKLFFA